jgi:hypothetical protein
MGGGTIMIKAKLNGYKRVSVSALPVWELEDKGG